MCVINTACVHLHLSVSSAVTVDDMLVLQNILPYFIEKTFTQTCRSFHLSQGYRFPVEKRKFWPCKLKSTDKMCQNCHRWLCRCKPVWS